MTDSNYEPKTAFMTKDPRPESGKARAYWNLLSHADAEIARLRLQVDVDKWLKEAPNGFGRVVRCDGQGNVEVAQARRYVLGSEKRGRGKTVAEAIADFDSQH